MPKTKTKKKTASPSPRARSPKGPSYLRRRSPVHGTGVFATRKIAKGEKIIEYAGERISHEEADLRHADKADDDNHTFLFTIDAKTVIDAGVDGNDSRFINHSCDPNCEVVIVDGLPIVEAIRAILDGEELAYDYNLTRAPEDPPEIDQIFACRCGAGSCGGTGLAPPRRRPAAPAPAPARARARGGRTKSGPAAKRSRETA
ncbi:hypothetical protein BH11MYX4_BH11MYX4_66180 [soil metagenome]